MIKKKRKTEAHILDKGSGDCCNKFSQTLGRVGQRVAMFVCGGICLLVPL